MLAGLMTATVLGGIAPAYAQNMDNSGGNRGERAARGDGQRGGENGARWQSRGEARTAAPVVAQQRQEQPRQERDQQQRARPDRQDRQWRDGRGQAVVGRQDTIQQQGRSDDRRNWQQAQRDDRRDDRRDERRTDRRDDRVDNRRDDRRWNDNRGAVGNGNWNNNVRTEGNWNNGRRYDDRTRWTDQRRWDNGWRQDNRYNWSSYRDRYGDRYRMGRYAAPRGWDYGYRRFSVGIVLSSLLYSNSYWLSDPYAYRLPPAYGTLRWVRYYDDAMLVDIRDGYVVDVIHDFFW